MSDSELVAAVVAGPGGLGRSATVGVALATSTGQIASRSGTGPAFTGNRASELMDPRSTSPRSPLTSADVTLVPRSLILGHLRRAPDRSTTVRTAVTNVRWSMADSGGYRNSSGPVRSPRSASRSLGVLGVGR